LSYSVVFDKGSGFILVTIDGELTLSLLEKVAAEVGEIENKLGCKLVINDLSNARLTEEALEVYRMPEKAQQMGVDHVCKRALVVGDRFSDFYFLETVFVNQGHLVKMFGSVDEAKRWLKQR